MFVGESPELPALALLDAREARDAQAGGADHWSRHVCAAPRRASLVLVVEDDPALSAQVNAIAGYVGLQVVSVPSAEDLGLWLDERRPMAVIAPFETEHQDGGHVLKSVAAHDRDLPVMLLTGRNGVYLGAAEALREVLRLSAAALPVAEPSLGEIVEFLAHAAQGTRRRRLNLVHTVAEMAG